MEQKKTKTELMVELQKIADEGAEVKAVISSMLDRLDEIRTNYSATIEQEAIGIKNAIDSTLEILNELEIKYNELVNQIKNA